MPTSPGSGSFGEVSEGLLDDSIIKENNWENIVNNKVAVKFLKKTETCNEFFKESLVVSQLKHENIVQFFGICLDIEDCLIMELMEGGELLDYLRSNDSSLTLDDQINMCLDVVKGCVYLEGKKVVHRDLAARNCLLSSTDLNERMVLFHRKLIIIMEFQNKYFSG